MMDPPQHQGAPKYVFQRGVYATVVGDSAFSNYQGLPPPPPSASSARNSGQPEAGPKLVVWITARATELSAAEEVISKRYDLRFARRQATNDLNYLWAENAKWKFCLSIPRQQGPVDMGSHAARVLSVFDKPVMAVMSGVCAGQRGEIALGDLIVAKTAYTMEVGGKVVSKGGQVQQLSATDMHTPHSMWSPTFEDLAHGFKNWDKCLPPNKTNQQERYVRLLIEIEEQIQGQSPSEWFKKTGYDTKKTPRHNFDALKLLLPSYPDCVECWGEPRADGFFQPPDEMYAHVSSKLRYREYPLEPRGPLCHYAPMLTGVRVRADDGKVFEEAHGVHRDTVGVDMEASVFYQVCRDALERTPVLVTKGVVDHADMDKDNQFHQYGNKMAAVFLLDAIEHVLAIPRDGA